MVDFGALRHLALLYLHEIPDVHPIRQSGLGADTGEGADTALRTDFRLFQHTMAVDACTPCHGDIAQVAVRPHIYPVTQRHPALDDHIDIDDHILAGLQLSTQIEALRIQQRHPGQHQRLGATPLVVPLQGRQLNPVVDAHHLRYCTRMGGLHRHPLLNRPGDDIGQIVLSLGVVVVQTVQPAPQSRRTGSQHAGVHLLNPALRFGSVLLLHDGEHPAGVVADDATITLRFGQVGGQQPQPLFRDLRQPPERVHRNQRHVAVEHHHRVVVRNGGHGLTDGVAGPELLCLFHPLHRLGGQRGAYHLPSVTIDHMDLPGRKAPGGLYHVLQHRLATDGVQNLGQGRTHTRPLARREYDDAEI